MKYKGKDFHYHLIVLCITLDKNFTFVIQFYGKCTCIFTKTRNFLRLFGIAIIFRQVIPSRYVIMLLQQKVKRAKTLPLVHI